MFEKICDIFLNYTNFEHKFQEKIDKMNQVSQQDLNRFNVSIDAVKKYIDKMNDLYRLVEDDYKDLETICVAYDQKKYSSAMESLNKHRQELIGKFWELGADAVEYYKSLSGNTHTIII